MNEICFDKESHRYLVDGKPAVSVTQYLRLAGFVDYEWCSEEGRQRGQAVHAAIHYLNENDLDDSSLHPTVQPYVAAYRKFADETGFGQRLVEHRVYDPIYGYAGTLDVLGLWNLSGGNILIDFKTGPIEDHVALQLAAYAACIEDVCARGLRRFALQLKDDGTYRLSKEYRDLNDIKIFRAIVSTVNWRIKHGLLVPDEALAA